MEDKKFNPDSYWEDRLHKISGLEGVGFKKLGQSFNKWAYKVRKKVFDKQLKKLGLNFNQSSVLDIGSGTGFYIQAWRELGCTSITGVDITPTSVENLKKTFPKQHFFQCDIGDTAFNTNAQFARYDMVSAMDVLFHIVDDKRFEQSVKNISSLINKNGYFIYSDNFLKAPTKRGESQVSRSNDYLMKVFSENGFEVVVHKPFMYLTNAPIDSTNVFLKAHWFLLENFLYVLPFMGHIIGPCMYPLEMLLVNTADKSPTTEFVIFRKK
jgi:2-polyprenyl-3-methyl-5-hydroxy-6-metoxy-1,4-benzoquinol methylase